MLHILQADKAIHERVRILALTRIVYGSTHWKLAEAHVSLAEDYLELKGKWGSWIFQGYPAIYT